ncbi:uncharacterized protein EV420DRAFT_1474560 [Desarmillaria tabescens]|uniref:Uncharacterized protein n=1 Tax=Armillaria tabescens TaxID=1929756 RepID=A0AA39NK93_ARMTA|nr:uncharacterized protein EV420DRAFT_1474560 [Desarmillaria tabescens]KAK0467193.1 hypothetical protein EV420DRAFT_1474560 [Desarmillaria tabescens]
MSLSSCVSESDHSLAAASSFDLPPAAPKLLVPLRSLGPEHFMTPVFPFFTRYIWFTIDAKTTLAGLNDPEVDIITQDMRGKIYVGCAIDVRFSTITLPSPEQFTGIESWMSFPLAPQVEDPRPDREPLYPTNALPLPGFCHWTILPIVTCKFPKDRREPGDAAQLGSTAQRLYFTAKYDDMNSQEPLKSNMPPAGALARNPFCVGGYDISS